MHYTKKVISKFENPKSIGFFTPEDALGRQIRLAIGEEGDLSHGQMLRFYWLVDESDGVIADVKYQVFGSPLLLAAAEVACELLLRKNYDQARRLSAELIDQRLRDKNDLEAFSAETGSILNQVLGAIEDTALHCMDIPLADGYLISPIATEEGGERREYPGWLQLSPSSQIGVIEEVIAVEIRPYVELDAGGVKILNIVEGREVHIAYEGSCTSCYAATGSTLTAIQQILRAKVHPDLVVIPDLREGGAAMFPVH